MFKHDQCFPIRICCISAFTLTVVPFPSGKELPYLNHSDLGWPFLYRNVSDTTVYKVINVLHKMRFSYFGIGGQNR